MKKKYVAFAAITLLIVSFAVVSSVIPVCEKGMGVSYLSPKKAADAYLKKMPEEVNQGCLAWPGDDSKKLVREANQLQVSTYEISLSDQHGSGYEYTFADSKLKKFKIEVLAVTYRKWFMLYPRSFYRVSTTHIDE